MTHREQRTFTITLHLSAEFADDYAGDEDGYAWHEHFLRALRPGVLAAVFGAVRAEPRFRAVSAPRGRDPESGLDLDVSFQEQPEP